MRRSTADVAAAIPGAVAYEVVHEGRLSVAQQHNWNLTDPQLFNAMVRAWMTGAHLPAAFRPLES
jgi:hypothetical protein